jgi:hypothetical protein
MKGLKYIRVKAVYADVKVPLEMQRGKFIGLKPCKVPDNAYYRRRIADGDLMIVNNSKR